jgi:ABC-type sugar transport system substrate-binding protein
MSHKKNLLAVCVLLIAIVLVATFAAACGSDKTETTAATTATTAAPATTTTAAPTDTTAATTATTAASTDTTVATPTTINLDGYTAADAQYIGAGLAEPVKKDGYKFKVGYLQPWAGGQVLFTIEKSCKAKIEELGGEFISYDAGLDTQKQVSQMDTLIAQKVDLIFAYPVSEASLTQGMAAAKKAGIPVVLVNVPSNSETPVDPSAQAMVGMAFDAYDYATIKYISTVMPGAKVAFIGFAPPAENLIHIVGRANYWADQLGLKNLGQVDAIDATPGAAGVAAQAIIAKYPDVQVIIAYNDYATMGAATALQASGKTGILVATMNGGQDITAAAIKAGTALCAYRNPWEQVGLTAAIAGYDILTQQNLPLPQRLLILGTLATKDNVDQLTYVK